MEVKFPALRRDLSADVKGTLEDALWNLKKLLHMRDRDNLAAFRQRVYTRIEEKMTALVLDMEHFKNESTRLQEHLTVHEAQDLSKTSLIPSIAALQGEVASLMPKLNAVSNIDTRAIKIVTLASRMVSEVSYAEHIVISADHAPIPCVLQRAAPTHMYFERQARELDTATLLKARFNDTDRSAA